MGPSRLGNVVLKEVSVLLSSNAAASDLSRTHTGGKMSFCFVKKCYCDGKNAAGYHLGLVAPSDAYGALLRFITVQHTSSLISLPLG